MTTTVTGYKDESRLLKRVKGRSGRLITIATSAVAVLAVAVEVYELSGAWLIGGALVIVVAGITAAAAEL